MLTVQASPAPAPLVITTTSLPEGRVGVDYKATSPTGMLVPVTLMASGGTQPYTWSLASGSLHPGLSLSSSNSTGVISGKPTKPGSTSFTVRVRDKDNAHEATKAFTIKVRNR